MQSSAVVRSAPLSARGRALPGDVVLAEEALSLVVRHVSQSRLQDTTQGNQQGPRVIGIDPLLESGQPDGAAEAREKEQRSLLIRSPVPLSAEN